MSKFWKLFSWVGIIIGFAGAGFGIYAATNPGGAIEIMKYVDMEKVTLYLGIGIPVFVVFVCLLAFIPLIFGSLKNSRNKKRLMQIGQRAQARILGIRDTGITMNLQPYVEIELELPGGNKTSIKTFISRVNLPRIGDTVEILYDPANPTEAIFAPKQ